MSNKLTLLISSIILLTFFIAGLLDIMYDFDILGNLVSRFILFGGLIGIIVYLIKINTDKHKKNLP